MNRESADDNIVRSKTLRGWAAAVGLGAALVLGGCSKSVNANRVSGTTDASEVSSTTMSSTTEAPATTEVPVTTEAPSTTVVSAKATCDVAHLAEAVQTKEGFDPRDVGLDPPGLLDIICVDEWAMASVDRPDVGTTDGATLFRFTGGSWGEVGEVGWPPVDCRLVKMGVPADIAPQLSPPPSADDERQACADLGLPPLS